MTFLKEKNNTVRDIVFRCRVEGCEGEDGTRIFADESIPTFINCYLCKTKDAMTVVEVNVRER